MLGLHLIGVGLSSLYLPDTLMLSYLTMGQKGGEDVFSFAIYKSIWHACQMLFIFFVYTKLINIIIKS
ncbi:hypothetical protein C3E89_09595 [Clostridium sp. Cult1]|nr:hypothetical protein [Clostridium sp. Cult1]